MGVVKQKYISSDSEEDAAMLKANVCKAGEITDVVASIGGWWQKGPVLEQSLDEYNKPSITPCLTILCLHSIFLSRSACRM
ncbi:hypothetical protein EMCRGX_G020927 [Ephydatia muelleri]